MDLTREQQSPLVSAIIPTRNRSQLVVRAVLSALQQTGVDVEVIVVIDGPDAETEQALQPLLNRQKLRVIALSASVGGAEARNSGVRAARADWIAFLDDDDEWLPQKLSKQLLAAESIPFPYPVICTRMIARSPLNDRIWPRRLPAPNEPMSEYLFCRRGLGHGDGALQTSTILARKTLLLELPFEPGLKRHQDWDWILRVSVRPDVRIEVLAEPLAIYAVEGSRTSVGRVADSAFSLQWASERRALITPKAYSFFIATECVTRARKSKEGLRRYLRLLYEFTVKGSPCLSSCMLLTLFFLVPERSRRSVRDIFAGLRSSRFPNASAKEPIPPPV